MSETQKTTFELDLDSKEFLKGLLEAKGAIGSLGDVKNLDGLISSLGTATLALGALGVAAYAVGKSFEAVFEAENIKAINAQFDQLTKSVGISGEALREALDTAAMGLLDDEDVLEIANRAIVNMGVSAQRLGGLLDDARKIALSSGRDVKETFDTLSRAVEFQNTRMLRSIGINIDLEKAYKKYAETMKVNVATLSEAGKQEALLNAIQEKTKKNFSGGAENVKEATTAWIQFKVAINQIGEAIVLFWDKTVGPTVVKIFKGMADAAQDMKVRLTAYFGEGREKSTADLELLQNKLKQTEQGIKQLEKIAANPVKSALSVDVQKDLNAAKLEAEDLQKAIRTLQNQLASKSAGENGEKKPEITDAELVEKERIKAKRESLAIERDIVEERLRLTQDEGEATLLFYNKQAIEMEELNRKQAEIQASNIQNKADLIEDIETKKNLKLLQADDELERARDQAARNRVNQAKHTADGVVKAAKYESQQAANAVKDFARLGKVSFDAFKENAVSGLIALGDGSKDAGEAMKGFMFGSLADIAAAEGKLLLASVLVNPLNGAAGAALLVLSGVLRSMSGSSSSASSLSGGGGSAGGYESPAYEPQLQAQADQESRLEESQQTRKAVTIQVMGNYFETEQTKRQLAEIIREHQDATDFTFKEIGTA